MVLRSMSTSWFSEMVSRTFFGYFGDFFCFYVIFRNVFPNYDVIGAFYCQLCGAPVRLCVTFPIASVINTDTLVFFLTLYNYQFGRNSQTACQATPGFLEFGGEYIMQFWGEYECLI